MGQGTDLLLFLLVSQILNLNTGLPFQPATFDGVISISAIQWVCYAESNLQDPRQRLLRFFASLYSVMKRHAKAILQFYPENPEQALLIAQTASKVGFTGGLVIDYPNSSKAKKYYLCLSFERSYSVPKALGTGSVGVEVVNKTSLKKIRAGKKVMNTKEWIMAKKVPTLNYIHRLILNFWMYPRNE